MPHNYISDIALVQLTADDHKQAETAALMSKYVKQGYYFNLDPDATKFSDNSKALAALPDYYGFMVKYTSDASKAFSDVVIVQYSDKEDVKQTLTINGKTYSRIPTEGYQGSDFDGALPRMDESSYLYIYATKDHDEPMETDSLLTDVRFAYDTLKNPVQPYFSSSHGLYTTEKSMIRFLKDNDYYVAADYHYHSPAGDLLLDDSLHYKHCELCNKKSMISEHNFGAPQHYQYHNKHFKQCLVCNRIVSQDCDAEYNADGFGYCSQCDNVTFQPAELKDSIYQITNAGQLYWFGEYATYQNQKANAKLLNNINLVNDVNVGGKNLTVDWKPICAIDIMDLDSIYRWEYDYKADLSIVDPGYKGTFDGNGYTIRNLTQQVKVDSRNNPKGSMAGLFGFVHSGTVKNLGLEGFDIHTDITTDDPQAAGALGAVLDDATVSNISSNGNLYVGTSQYLGGIGGLITGSKLNNCLFSGRIRTEMDTPTQVLDNPVGYLFEVPNSQDVHHPTTVSDTLTRVFVYRPDYDSLSGKNTFEGGITYIPETDITDGRYALLLNDSLIGADAPWRQNVDATTCAELDSVPVINRAHCIVAPAKYNGNTLMNFFVEKGSNGMDTYSRDSLKLDNTYDYAVPVEFHNRVATYALQLDSANCWTTICIPFQANSSDNVQLYTIDKVAGTKVYLKHMDSLPAGVPGIVHARISDADWADGIRCIDIQTTDCDAIKNPDNSTSYDYDGKSLLLDGFFTSHMVNRASTYKADYGWTYPMVLTNDAENQIQLYGLIDNVTMPPFSVVMKSYSQDNSYDNKLDIILPDDDVIGISQVSAQNPSADAPMYDVNGYRIWAPRHGQIIIRNGHKFSAK